jgi:hypothetical protein
MVEYMTNVVLVATKMAIQTRNHISINCNEIININNQTWILMHVYVVWDFKRVSILKNP